MRLSYKAICVLVVLFALFYPQFVQAQTEQTQILVRILDLYRLNKCNEAIPVMEPFVKANPNNIEVRMFLGDCLTRLKHWDGAATQFKAVLALAPGHVDALKGLRRVAAGRQSVRQSEQLTAQLNAQLEEKARAENNTIVENTRQAESAIRAKDLDKAQALLEQVLAMQPSNVTARQRLAEVYSSTRQFNKAIAQYRLLKSVPDLKLAASLQIARNLEWKGEFPEAATAYQRYLVARPGDSEARRGLANVLTWSGHYTEAVVEYEKLEKAGVSDVSLQLALADCYEHLAKVEPALHAYESALQLMPDNTTALQGRARTRKTLEEQPRRAGYRFLEAGDLEASVHSFEKYLDAHPGDDATIVQIARLRTWMQQYPAAIEGYRAYLKDNPSDTVVRRELARVFEWSYQYADALKEFETLAEGPDATAEDYEHLVQINLWTGNIPAAAAYSDPLSKMDPDNAVAAQASNLYGRKTAILEQHEAERVRLADRNVADTLAATGRFRQAIEAYQKYMSNYGYDRTIELTIARLYSWAADYVVAKRLYTTYLEKYPDDVQARYELGNVENWSGDLSTAKATYKTVLAADSGNVAARMGLAQVGDYAGDDRVVVLQHFKDVLAIDPDNAEAKRRVDIVRLEVAPVVSYSFSGIRDSDGLERSSHSMSASFTFRGGVRLESGAVYTEFAQNRLVSSDYEGAGDINRRIEDTGGRAFGRGVYAGLSVDRSHWSVATRAGAFRYDTASYLPQAEINLELRPSQPYRIQLNLRRSEASSELNTIGSVVSGMSGTSAELLYRQLLGNRFAITTSGGITEYSSEIKAPLSDSRLKRGMVRLDFLPSKNMSFGYVGRLNRFDRQSPLYFSPDVYDMHGVAYRISGHITPRFSLTIDGEAGRSLVHTTNSLETSIAGRFTWRIRPSLEILGTYRWGKSSRTAFDSAIYRIDGFELNIRKVF